MPEVENPDIKTQLENALQVLSSRTRSRDFNGTREFKAVADLCTSAYGVGRAEFALGNALRSLGLGETKPGLSQNTAFEARAAASDIDRAFQQKSSLRRYLCPLNLADDLPELNFGGSQIRRYDEAELGRLFQVERLSRHYPGRPLDVPYLSQFRWLVVEEPEAVHTSPDVRALPVLGMDMSADFGAVAFHVGRLPIAVERALFFLLLAQWEEWSTMLEVDWRGFTIPWVYAVDEDLFARPNFPPSLTTLSTKPVTGYDSWGDQVEIEVPEVLNLPDEAFLGLARFNETAWLQLELARTTPLFETPIAHFMVRAFQTEGIDEFMAHMTAIEAAVGLEMDHKKRLRPKPDKHNKLSATDCIAARVAALLNEGTVVKAYRDLFDLRSQYVHGRAGLQMLSTAQRIKARSLARSVVRQIVDLSGRAPITREDIMIDLLDRGAHFL